MAESKQTEADKEQKDLGGYAPALHHCPHVDSALTIPKSADRFPDLSSVAIHSFVLIYDII